MLARAAPADLEDRLILALVNECAACLRERVVDDADLAMPRCSSAPASPPSAAGRSLMPARAAPAAIIARLKELAARHGPRFTPDAGWALLAAGQKT